ncbi:MAG: hypothetical protein ABI241_00620 [Bacteroidia bacterium]
MNETLRQNIENMRFNMNGRIKQLDGYIREYKKANDFENAMKCDIKRRQLLIVLDQINKALEL